MRSFHIAAALTLFVSILDSSSAFQVNGGRNFVTTIRLDAKKKVSKGDEEQEDSTGPRQQPSSSSYMDPAKRAALDGVLNQIERNYGRGSIVKLGDAGNMVVESISSGALTLDAALGGGFPKGRVVEIYGPESSGKTTLALHAIAEAQKLGGTAAFVDAEHALDPMYGTSLLATLDTYLIIAFSSTKFVPTHFLYLLFLTFTASQLGVDVDNLLVSQPDCGEMALDIVDKLVRSAAVDVIVVDSVAALVPR
jgi:recombination protein RecA